MLKIVRLADPDKILTREALTQPAATIFTPEEYDNQHTKTLQEYLGQLLLTARNVSTQNLQNRIQVP
jgi:hypothetical protein